MIYIIDLEPIESRYTSEWKTHLANTIAANTGKEVYVISGKTASNKTTPGAFLDFMTTNIYKSEQLIELANLFNLGNIKTGDTILFTDAWNPAILMTRYMIELSSAKPKIAALWHAGSYDKNDFLGRMENKTWAGFTETAFYAAIDDNLFATKYHEELFFANIKAPYYMFGSRSRIVGFPFEYIQENAKKYYDPLKKKKENLVVFPHRIAPEKQVELFKDAVKYLPPDIKVEICQEKNLTKEEYYDVLSRAKLVFSANLQETLGIGVYEAMEFGCDYLVPDRLSYREMYSERYSQEEENSSDITKMIVDKIRNYDTNITDVHPDTARLREVFFSSKELCKYL